MSHILFVAWIAACVSAVISYWIAGPVWQKFHSVRFKIGAREFRWSGAIGEIALVTLCAVGVQGIDTACPAITLDELCVQYWPFSLGLLLWCVLVAYIHGVRTALKSPPDIRTRLFFTYLVYGVFSVIFFTGGGLVLGLVLVEMHADNLAFAESLKTVPLLTHTAYASEEAFSRALELSFLESDIMLHRIQQSMNPTFAVALGLFVVNLVVRVTPLRSLYRTNAALWTYAVLWTAILMILLSGGYLYVQQYNRLLEDLLREMRNLQQAAADQFPGQLQRYTDIYIQLSAQNSLVAFITRMSNEWAGLTAILGALQWGVEKFSQRESAASPADEAPAH